MRRADHGAAQGDTIMARGDSTKVNPIVLQDYLGAAQFPADKWELINYARDQGAPEDVLYVMEQFDEREYDSPGDVIEEIGRLG